MKEKCPRCGSTQTAPILYGMPAFDDEMEAKLKAKQLYIGGCCVSGNDPQHHCFGCNLNFHTLPQIASKRYGLENLPEAVTGLEFVIGGYFGGYQKIRIGKFRNQYRVTVSPNSMEEGESYVRAILEEEWEALKNKLFDEIYLHEWHTHYCDPDVCDGEQWELTLKLTNRRKRCYSGSNAFPPYWIPFLKLLRPYFGEAGQELSSNGESEDDDSLEKIRDQLAIRSAEYFMFMDD